MAEWAIGGAAVTGAVGIIQSGNIARANAANQAAALEHRAKVDARQAEVDEYEYEVRAQQALRFSGREARELEWNAQAALRRAEMQALMHEGQAMIQERIGDKHERDGRRQWGTTRARAAASGAAFSGSSVAVARDKFSEAAEDAKLARHQASLYRERASFERTEARAFASMQRVKAGEALWEGDREASLMRWRADVGHWKAEIGGGTAASEAAAYRGYQPATGLGLASHFANMAVLSYQTGAFGLGQG